MNDNLSKIKERIEKLLALSKNNSNQNEAEIAAMKAQELMMQYKLDTAIFETKQENIDYELVSLDSRQTSFWKLNLFDVLAKNNFCMAVGARRGYIYLFGKKQDRELVIYLYNNFSKIIENVCEKEWLELCKNYKLGQLYKGTQLADGFIQIKPNGKTWKHSYYLGLVAGLGSKLEAQLANMMGNENVYAMIKLSDQLINQKIKETLGKLVMTTTRFDDKAYGDGVEKGKTINNNLALGSGK